MRTLILGDIHGDPIWKQIVEKEQYDRIIFLGDYFDSFTHLGVEQLHNFNEIVSFKKTSTKEVVMLFGNHDYHYMPGFSGPGYSGYQAALAYQFRDAISQNLEHLQMVYLFDDVMCSHAGVSVEWLTNTFGEANDESQYNWNVDSVEAIKNVVEIINDHFKYKPVVFDFNGWDPYGDNTYQTPIWIRPASLFRANKESGLKKNIIQVVGHTQVKSISEALKASKKTMNNRYYLADALNTSGEYLIHEDGEFKVGEKPL